MCQLSPHIACRHHLPALGLTFCLFSEPAYATNWPNWQLLSMFALASIRYAASFIHMTHECCVNVWWSLLLSFNVEKKKTFLIIPWENFKSAIRMIFRGKIVKLYDYNGWTDTDIVWNKKYSDLRLI